MYTIFSFPAMTSCKSAAISVAGPLIAPFSMKLNALLQDKPVLQAIRSNELHFCISPFPSYGGSSPSRSPKQIQRMTYAHKAAGMRLLSTEPTDPPDYERILQLTGAPISPLPSAVTRPTYSRNQPIPLLPPLSVKSRIGSLRRGMHYCPAAAAAGKMTVHKAKEVRGSGTSLYGNGAE